jgi:hypothetical protein
MWIRDTGCYKHTHTYHHNWDTRTSVFVCESNIEHRILRLSMIFMLQCMTKGCWHTQTQHDFYATMYDQRMLTRWLCICHLCLFFRSFYGFNEQFQISHTHTMNTLARTYLCVKLIWCGTYGRCVLIICVCFRGHLVDLISNSKL